MGNDGEGPGQSINRYAIGDALPSEMERIAEWVRDITSIMTGVHSEWSEEERDRARPGYQFLVEVVDGELAQARAEFKVLQETVTTDAALLLGQWPSCRRVAEVEQVQAQRRGEIRATLRGYLREVVDMAQSLGVTDDELVVLLADAAGRDGSAVTDPEVPEPAPGAAVIPIAARQSAHRRPNQA